MNYWTLYTDQMPDNYETVDVIIQTLSSFDSTKSQKRIPNCWFKDGDFLQGGGGGMMRVDGVTHWMYPPSMPPVL